MPTIPSRMTAIAIREPGPPDVLVPQERDTPVPKQGEVLVEGARLSGDTDPKKRRIGLVPQDLALYDELSARAKLLQLRDRL